MCRFQKQLTSFTLGVSIVTNNECLRYCFKVIERGVTISSVKHNSIQRVSWMRNSIKEKTSERGLLHSTITICNLLRYTLRLFPVFILRFLFSYVYFICDWIAQSVECLLCNRKVTGSIPSHRQLMSRLDVCGMLLDLLREYRHLAKSAEKFLLFVWLFEKTLSLNLSLLASHQSIPCAWKSQECVLLSTINESKISKRSFVL